MFPEPKFSPFWSFFFASREYALSVSLLRGQQMKHNASQFVSGNSDRRWFAQFSGHTSEEFAEVVVGVVQ
jgi:hypothetical protein